MPQIVIKLGDNVVQNYTFDKPILNIGRSRDNDIVIDNLAVSRNHCRVRVIDDKYVLTDLNSANGSFVNGVRVTKTEVMNEDIISIGKHKLIFTLEAVKGEEEIGDAFTADRTMIVENAPEGVLTVTKGKNRGEKYKLTKYETTIGRATENDVVLNDWFVSKVHAKLIKQGGHYMLKDLGSWKGSFVNDKAVKEPVLLRENDELRFGSTKLVFAVHDENKILQIEGRKPEELGYDASAAQSPAFQPPPSEPAMEPAAKGGWSVPDYENEAAPEKPASLASFGMGAGGGSVEELNFDDLPDPFAERDAVAMEAQLESAGSVFEVAESTGPKPVQKRASEDATPMPSAPSRNGGAIAPHGAQWTDFDEETPPPAPAAVRPASRPASRPAVAAPATASSPPAPAPVRAAAPATAPSAPEAEGESPEKMVAVWEKALHNKSPLIRKQAAKMLKKMTGKDYEIPE